MSAFVPVVVPCTTRSACASSSSSDIPNRDAASSIASKKLRRAIRRAGGDLAGPDRPVRADDGAVGERAADVDADAVAAHRRASSAARTEALPTSSQS